MTISKEKRNELLQDMIDYEFDQYLKGRDMNIIGENLEYFRNIREYTAEELCIRAKISRSTLYKIETGKIIPKLSTLIKIVDALAIVGDSFFDFLDEIKKTPVEEMLGDQNNYNIYKMEEEIMKLFNGNICYYQGGRRQYLPSKYIEIIKRNISASFSLLDVLNHDNDQGDEFHMINKKSESTDRG